MNRQTAQQGLLAAFLGLVVLQVVRAAAAGKWSFPEPRLLMAPTIIYTGLSVLSEVSPELAVAFGAGIDIAVAVSPSVANSLTGVISQTLGVNSDPNPIQTTAAQGGPFAGAAKSSQNPGSVQGTLA